MASASDPSEFAFTVDFIKEMKSLSYEMKIKLKKNGRPQPTFAFSGNRQCNLQMQYSKYSWLTACPQRKALFCFPCLLFKPNSTIWSTNGVTDLGNYSNYVKKHVKSHTHLSAVTALELLGKVRIDEALNLEMQRSRYAHNEEVRANREILKHHVKAAVYLSLQGLPFRGHSQAEGSHNKGNFVELVTLLGEFSLNPLLNKMINERNPTFSGLSSDIQNDIIKCLHDHVLTTIKDRISLATCVSIMADETTDMANRSQLAVSVRLVWNGDVYEHLIDLVDVSSDRTAGTLASNILESLLSVGIDKDKPVIGQSYDGAQNMMGKNNSVQTKVREVWPNARFIHCHAHKWNLVVQSITKHIANASIFFGIVQNVINFFRSSPKRATLLSASLPRASQTRWLTRGKSVSVIYSKYREIITVLDTITVSTDFDSNARAEARGILNNLRNRKTVFLLLLFKRIFELSDVITKKLQTVHLDPVEIESKVNDYRKNLTEMRRVSCFENLIQQCGSLINFDENASRKRKINDQSLRDSGYTPSTDTDVTGFESLKIIMFEIIDVLLQQLDNRFENLKSLEWIKLFHPTSFDRLKVDAHEVIRLIDILVQYDKRLVPDKESFRNQLTVLYNDEILQTAITGVKDPASLLKKMFALNLCDALPLISKSLIVSQTIALTSVTCERQFSVLRRLKNYLRSTMMQDRLKYLMVLNIERDLLKDLTTDVKFVDGIIDRFASMKERSIKLQYKF